MSTVSGTTGRRRTGVGLVLGAAGLAVLSGCEVDSFFDQSTVGRWEKTPTVMPILDRLSAIEDQPEEYVATSTILPADLVPEVDQYRVAAGDQVEVRIRDFFTLGQEEIFQRPIDQRGYIELPRLGSIRVQGRTNAEILTLVENAVRERQINERPVVSVALLTQRKQTYSVMGAVQSPGQYLIPEADFRLLSAMTSAGSFSETIPFVYVIRQVPLTEEAAGRYAEPEPTRRSRAGRPPSDVRPPTPPPSQGQGQEPAKGEELIDLINELSKPKPVPQGSPGMVAPQPAPGTPTRRDEPPIDLPDSTQPAQPTAATGGGGWVYVDGKWVRSTPEGAASGPGPRAVTEQSLLTQRVIKVPVGPLLAGDAGVNIVVRPGDVIRVPSIRGGQFYMGGQVQRPGAFSLPFDGRITLLRALDSAGGLTGIGIPERVDLTRMVGSDKQATIRIDLKAIGEQTQPDIYLKPDDRINVGTNFWATPLAVLRGGLRASYGFGFILDRNFQGDVFGVDRASGRN